MIGTDFLMAKPKIYLIDLNHLDKDRAWSIIPFPLSIGYLAAYVQKMLPDVFEIELFKDPHELLLAIEKDRPAIAGFSNYIWNKNLQLQFARHLKKVHPDCLTIMGGADYNFAELDWVEDFARTNPQIDFHIEGEGEAKFLNIVACALENDFDKEKVECANPAGATYISRTSNTLIHNTIKPDEALWSCLDSSSIDVSRGRLLDLNDIPSPYLTGYMNKFLSDPSYCPIIETNRGCPYSCTFCNWGAMGKSKSASFSMARVVAELEFISAHNVSRTPYLYIGDANFGLFSRDIEIAKMLRTLKDENGFPQNVYLYYAKNSSEKVLQIAEILKDMSTVSLSRQTQNEDVLKAIKRSNISIDTFNDLAALAKSLGVESRVELIYMLPGESKESFFSGVREIMGNSVDGLHFFPAMLLNGSEMGTQQSRDTYGLKGEWRQIDGCAGEYGPVKAMEYEEIITSSAVMTREEHFEIRLFHFFQAIFLDTKFYKEIVYLTGDVSIIDFILDIIASYKSADQPFRDLIDDFFLRAKQEFMDAPPKSWSSADINAAKNRSVKLNPLFTVKLLYDPGVREAFHQFLTRRLEILCGTPAENSEPILEYLSARIYPFDGQQDHFAELHLDLDRFVNRPASERQVSVVNYVLREPQSYRFHKAVTYQEFVEARPQNALLSECLYDIVLHHSHERPFGTLASQFVGKAGPADHISEDQSASADDRVIQLDGAWIY